MHLFHIDYHLYYLIDDKEHIQNKYVQCQQTEVEARRERVLGEIPKTDGKKEKVCPMMILMTLILCGQQDNMP